MWRYRLPFGMSQIFDVDKISFNDLQDISDAPNLKAKQCVLLHALEIEKIDEESELRKSIVLDFGLDLIVFCCDKGLAWKKIHTALKFAISLLSSTACIGKELSEATEIFKAQILQIASIFSMNECQLLVDYFLGTFFRHYKLYLFCMTKERMVDQSEESMDIQAPFVAEELSTGVDIEKWNYQQNLRKIEDEKELSQTKRQENLQTKIERLDEEKLATGRELEGVFETLNSDDLPNVLEKLTKLHVDLIDFEIQKSLEDSSDNVEFTVKRGALVNPGSAKLRPVSRSRPKSKQRK